ncbi:YjbH domain-containing protein [Pseudoroseicyclus tamaricis]|uniref:YjbH domain-containing protein n=1 Tax=Pseudoroseicyclus tamaricis TaxID=2705421 RepID=A0A6B2JN96_9RHOB|nr:YjbH domain-containing protein [Pseudoroseicyclus tamaricis]NDU99384.1 YjbH domain-containing protein [Pseudoroseicyclus tamaricis]
MAVLTSSAALAQESRPYLNTFGLPGLIDMPSGEALPPDSLALTLSYFEGEYRATMAFQVLPQVTGVFRYIALPDAGYFDRSFDVHILIAEEGEYLPSLRLGLIDVGGTGLYSSEYISATKEIVSGVQVTGGIGWGRLAGRNAFDNPLAVFDDYFDNRPTDGRGIEGTGRIRPDVFFRGDAALFGGVRWTPSDNLSFAAEYSSDTYPFEARRLGFTQDSPINVSASYRFDGGTEVTGYYLYGNTVGLTVARTFFPGNLISPGGRAASPPPLAPRRSAAELGWSAQGYEPAATARIERELNALGMASQGVTISGNAAVLRLDNPTYQPESQAIGRAARVMANALPAEIETLVIVPVVQGMPTSEIRFRRSDLEALEFDLEGTWSSFVRADISDGSDVPVPEGSGFAWSLRPYTQTSYFDPDAPVRVTLGAALTASYEPLPGFVLSGQLRQPIVGNLDDQERRSESVLPRVRSDSALYDANSDTEIAWLTTEKFFRPGPELYGRLTFGILERMYGGASAEVLWAPVASRLALGAEVNYAVQRDFDGIGFQDYDIVTGHGSVYYDFENGFVAQMDAGRYLAGDWGATFSLDREFDNGISIGAFFTLTDVPFDDFGEGAFDKGITISLPISALTGEPTRDTFTETLRPVLRDGGARLNVRNRLYDLTHDYTEPELGDSWGRFWR